MSGEFVTRHVVVTQEHIDNGERDQSLKCPVALALGDGTEVYGPDCAPLGRPIGDPFVTLPGEVAAWIYRFDAGEPVEPFEFDIDWPIWSEQGSYVGPSV